MGEGQSDAEQQHRGGADRLRQIETVPAVQDIDAGKRREQEAESRRVPGTRRAARQQIDGRERHERQAEGQPKRDIAIAAPAFEIDRPRAFFGLG